MDARRSAPHLWMPGSQSSHRLIESQASLQGHSLITFENDCLDSESRPSSNPRIIAPLPPNPAGWLKGIEPRPARRRLASMSRQGCHATGTGTLSFPPRSILVNFILAYKNELPLQNHATSFRGMIHSSGMAHRCKSP